MEEQKKKRQRKKPAAQEVQEAAGNMPIKENAGPGATDPKEQEAAAIIKDAQEVQEDIAQKYNITIEAMENAGDLAQLAEMVNTIRAAGAPVTRAAKEMMETAAAVQRTLKDIVDFVNSDTYKAITTSLAATASLVRDHRTELDAIAAASDTIKDLSLFIIEELEESNLSKQYTLQDVIEQGFDEDGNMIESPFRDIIERAKKRLAAFEDTAGVTIAEKTPTLTTIEAQKAGRELRRQVKENALNSGAIMNLQGGNLVTFSEKDLWDAFAPGRISKIGTLSRDLIDEETGRIKKSKLDKGEIMPVNAMEVSFRALTLLNTILANSVENYREYFIEDGAIKFYVKGVLDDLDIEPRIRNDGQLDINRKTAGVLYLEKQFEPLLSFIGTTPDGSRYSVFSYEGYDVNTDTMTIRIPYLFQLWKTTQTAFAKRMTAREQRIAEGKNPLKKDTKPLEVNALFKTIAYKEDDTVLEIATYITNVLLVAGTGAHKTEILFKTLIKNCPRLRERLENIESIPKTETQKDGKRINKTARYNSELRKIARAYSLIMNPEKCDALKNFSFESFTPTKEKDGNREFIPPTKSTLDGKISIKWRRIDPNDL